MSLMPRLSSILFYISDNISRNNSLVIQNTNIDGFKVGLQMDSIRVPVILRDNKFSSCDTALSYVKSNSNLSIESCSFNSSKTAILTQYINGRFHVTSSTIEMCDTAVDVDHGNVATESAKIQVENCVLTKNKMAFNVLGKTYRNYFKRIEVSFSHSTFPENAMVGNVNVGKKDTNGVFLLNFQNNTVRNSQRGVSFQSRNHENSVVVQNNSFLDGGNGTVLNLDGQTLFSSNTISNWSYPDGSLVRIKHLKSLCEVTVSNNTLTKNPNSRKIIDLTSHCENITISRNVISKNTVRQFVLDLMVQKDDTINSDVEMADNVLAENNVVVQNLCLTTSAMSFSGFRQILATRNVMKNPRLTYELLISQITLNMSSTLSIPYNYYGTSNPEEIGARIYDGLDGANMPVATIVPYYTSEAMDTESNSEPFSNFLGRNNQIGGRLTTHLTLSEGQRYEVIADVVIPTNMSLTLLPGSVLELTTSVGIHVYGMLHLKGSSMSPVTIRATNSAMNPVNDQDSTCGGRIRLVPDRSGIKLKGLLQMLQDGTWKGVCRSSWGWEDSHVACRELGYEAGGWHNVQAIYLSIYLSIYLFEFHL